MRQRIRDFMGGAIGMWIILFVIWATFKIHEEYQYRRWDAARRVQGAKIKPMPTIDVDGTIYPFEDTNEPVESSTTYVWHDWN